MRILIISGGELGRPMIIIVPVVEKPTDAIRAYPMTQEGAFKSGTMGVKEEKVNKSSEATDNTLLLL